jgi:beta-glucosidase
MLGAIVRRRDRPQPWVERTNDLGGVLMIRRCFVGLILVAGLGLLLPSAALGQATKTKARPKKPSVRSSTTTPVPRNDKWWMDRHEAMNARVKQGNADLLFIGDSITQGWEGAGKEVWKEFYGNRNAVNLGIGGDQTQHVLWRLEHGNLEGISPKLAVVMIGTNNSFSYQPEEIAAGIEAIVKTLRAKVPQTKILLLGIFPRGATPADQLRQVNEKTNAIAAKLADGKQVVYLDIGKAFLQPDGTLTKEIMPDLLHLSPKGYRLWAEAIEPEVAKVLGKQ